MSRSLNKYTSTLRQGLPLIEQYFSDSQSLHRGTENLALSLEFYDREAQCVLDEYTTGFVDKVC